MKQRGFEIIKDKPPTSEKELEYKARLSDDIADFYARGGEVHLVEGYVDRRAEKKPARADNRVAF